MNIIEQAEADLEFTLEDAENGFGVQLTLIDESENNYFITAKTNDVGFFIDPTTGVGVAGRRVSIDVRISTLNNQGAGIPSKKWKALYTSTNLVTWTMSVEQLQTDNTLGLYKLILEVFKP